MRELSIGMPSAGATAPFTSLYQDDHSVQPVLTPSETRWGSTGTG